MDPVSAFAYSSDITADLETADVLQQAQIQQCGETGKLYKLRRY